MVNAKQGKQQQGKGQHKAAGRLKAVLLVKPQHQRAAYHFAAACRHGLHHAAEAEFALGQDDAA